MSYVLHSDFDTETLEEEKKPSIPQYFDLEELYSLVEEYYDQTDGKADATLEVNEDNTLALLIVDKEEETAQVYYSEINDELFALMDKAYQEKLGGEPEIFYGADDFWDKWYAVVDSLAPTRIMHSTIFEK